MKYLQYDHLKRKGVLLLLVVGVLILLIARRLYAAKNYTETNDPFYAGNFAPAQAQAGGEITVVSYNIRYAENIEQAIRELEELQTNHGLDLLLLQEMDEIGVEQIARALQFNFVYYPAAIEPRFEKNFGNAVLSRWPITSSAKLVLPHKSISSRMFRTATRATIALEDIEILVYSVHAETKFTLPRYRMDQFRAIVADIDADADFVIIGGDFNSVTQADVQEIDALYRQEGFAWATRSSGHTVAKYRVQAVADLIFSKGFKILEDGKIEQALASDHLPIWTRLAIK